MKYDYLIVGAGLFGSTMARQLTVAGKDVIVIDQRPHIGGNCYTEEIEGIITHVYGPHLFHTNDSKVWNFVNKFAEFNNYQHRTKATFANRIFSLPFNMMTYNQMWGVTTPAEAQEIINQQIIPIENPANLEEWALSKVGTDIYQSLIYGYTKKQWRKDPKELPASIIKRLPLRMTYNDNYFDDHYQGVPKLGYTHMIGNMLGGIEIKLNEDFFNILNWRDIAKKLIYSGPIDRLLAYQFGDLEYLSLEFQHFTYEGNFQGHGQMNYTDENVPYTRIIEHQHFNYDLKDKSIITYEFPVEWQRGKPEYYPVITKENTDRYQLYKEEIQKQSDIIVGGRLGKFVYMDMGPTISMALKMAEAELV